MRQTVAAWRVGSVQGAGEGSGSGPGSGSKPGSGSRPGSGSGPGRLFNVVTCVITRSVFKV